MHNSFVGSKTASTILFVSLMAFVSAAANADLANDALVTAKKATAFLTARVSTEGGYLWRYSENLQLREGEGIVDSKTVWVQPPGTPAVGAAFVRLYEATGDRQFLEAARAAGEALRRGQMRSGGWQAMIEFDPPRRKKWAYRTEKARARAKDQSSLDDDKTQSALRFVMELDRALRFEDEAIHEMAIYALNGLLTSGQFENGGFPQVWTSERQIKPQTRPANYPATWSRAYQGHGEYWYQATLNDNLAPDVLRTLLLAEEIYGDAKYRRAATKLADFLLLAQMPEPQPAWAQQYNAEMQPIWARKFEPPAVTGGESQGVIETLMDFYEVTGEVRYLDPIPRALDYLKRSELDDGRLARFYELETNRPLYFTKQYELTYDDSDLPTHYGFKVGSRVDQLRERYQKLKTRSALQSNPEETSRTVSEDPIRRIVKHFDERGFWLSQAGLRYHKSKEPSIDMAVTTKNLLALADYLATSGRARVPLLWNPKKRLPKASELSRIADARFRVIKAHIPQHDGYDWLHGVALAWHGDRLYATFGHNTGSENTASEVAQSCYSEDEGRTWSELQLIDDGDGDSDERDLAVSHGVLLSTGGKLWAFHGAFYGRLRDVHTRAYVLDESAGRWVKHNTVIGDGFWPMDTPQRTRNGNWIVSGIRIKEGNGGANDPAAVAISDGNDLTKWKLVVIPKSETNAMWGESTVLADGSRLLNIARYREPIALVARSDDYGHSWSTSQVSNLPMAASKPFAGVLSTGARYMICTTTADSGNRRSPLTIAIADPGEPSFHRVLSIRGAEHDGPGESASNAALSYPYAVERDGNLYVAYSNDGGRGKNRNSAELAVIPIAVLSCESR